MNPAVAAACRCLIWMTTGIRPRQWVAVHRKHHAYTDDPGDPHSPVLDGYLTVQLANALLYRKSRPGTPWPSPGTHVTSPAIAGTIS